MSDYQPSEALVEATMQRFRRPGGQNIPKTNDLIRWTLQFASEFLSDPANAEEAHKFAAAFMHKAKDGAFRKGLKPDENGEDQFYEYWSPALYSVREADHD